MTPSRTVLETQTHLVTPVTTPTSKVREGGFRVIPRSSALSPLALDIVAQAARRADSATIVLIRANHDREAGETAQTALLRGDAVRDELIRQGVPKSAVRILISAATGTGIEARSVVVSVFRQQSTKSPAV